MSADRTLEESHILMNAKHTQAKTDMQTLTDLLNSASGLNFLQSEGVFATLQEFTALLKAPVKPKLAQYLNAQDKKLVCSGQQVYVDYRQSVLSKMESLRIMEQNRDLLPFFLWVDTDRTGSDNLMTKFAWPDFGKKGPITVLPPGTGDIESRFAPLDHSQLRRGMDRLETYLRQSGERKPGAKEKYQQLREIFTDRQVATLSDFNLRLTSFLLISVLGYVPRSLILSDLLNTALLVDEVNLFVNCITEVVRVFNEKRDYLVRRGVDPQVGPLTECYLPLFYSCEVDHKRLRLYHDIDGGDHFAACACKCGREYRFFLGQRTLSIAEITQAGRWSLDVCFPIFLNDLVSGFVAGKSSAIYLIVMNEVVRQVLGAMPVPILVPETLEAVAEDANPVDSLIYHYFAR